MSTASGQYPENELQGADGASQRVYMGILGDLEDGGMVPGQRLVETELAARFGVGRNAVREAMQRLAVRGIVDLSRHRSAAIRKLDRDAMMDVLDVAELMNGLIARTAARRFDPARDAGLLKAAMDGLAASHSLHDWGAFNRERRRFYRMLLQIGRNDELQRLFPAIGMHIVYAQFRPARLQDIRIADYGAIHDAVVAGDSGAAETAARQHVEHVRALILSDAAHRGY